jgi:hypothetical protein
MLSHVIALPLQVVIAWFAGPALIGLIPATGAWELFAYAVLYAVLVWIVGVVSAEIMQAELPSAGMLVASISLAIVGAAIYTWLPTFVPSMSGTWRGLAGQIFPFVGAILGYQVGRVRATHEKAT